MEHIEGGRPAASPAQWARLGALMFLANALGKAD